MKRSSTVLIGIALLVTAMLAGQAAAQDCVELPAGLVGWWPVDGSANDIQGGNGRTTFGRDDVHLRPCAIVLDDAHVGLDRVRGNFTLQVAEDDESARMAEDLQKTNRSFTARFAHASQHR